MLLEEQSEDHALRMTDASTTADQIFALHDLRSLRPDGYQRFARRHHAAAVRGGFRRSLSGGLIAVLPLYGVLAPRGTDPILAPWAQTSLKQVGREFRQALADPSISAIVLDIDSPGGAVYGVAELADEIQSARGGRKRIAAIANSLAASAAYWIASACDELSVTPSGEVGSIGLCTSHEDVSALEAKLGIRTTAKVRFVRQPRLHITRSQGGKPPCQTEASTAVSRRFVYRRWQWPRSSTHEQIRSPLQASRLHGRLRTLDRLANSTGFVAIAASTTSNAGFKRVGRFK